MHKLLSIIGGFLAELRRRKVYQVALAYVVVGFMVIEAADLTLLRLGLPPWTVTFVVVLVGLGFPIALVLAWALEVTPEGVQVEEPASEQEVRPAAYTTRDLWVGASVLVLLLLGGWWYFGGLGGAEQEAVPQASSLDANRVAVFPFEVRGAEELEYLGEGMVELMSRSLDGAGPLRAVDPKAVLTQVRPDRAPDPVGPGEGREVAAGFGAGRFVLGSVLRVGENIRLSATWYGASGKEIGSAEVTAESEKEIQERIDALARRAITDLAGGEASRRRRLAAQTTSSAEALKAYLEGQAARRPFEMDRAQSAFERALETDSTFALAHYGLSWAAGWQGNVDLALSAAARAVELSGGLPERDRRLVEAWHHFYRGRGGDAERLYRRIVSAHPSDVDAWHGLAETLFHFNPARGRPLGEAKRPLEKTLKLDPKISSALGHLLQIAALERDLEAVDSLSAEMERRAPEEWHGVRELVFGERPARELEETGSLVALTASTLLYRLGRFEKAEEALKSVLASELPLGDEVAARRFLAGILAAQGKLAAARRELAGIDALSAASHLVPRAQLAALPFLPESEDRAEARADLLDRLQEWDPEGESERYISDGTRASADLLPSLRLYLVGLLQAAEGNGAAARETARTIGERASPEVFSSLSGDLGRGLRAESARRAGDRQEALGHLEAVELQAPLGLPLVYTGARERYLRARLLAETGRLEEALRWYEALVGKRAAELAYAAPAHLGRGKVLDELGRTDEALEAYERFLELWTDADPALQPMVKEARQRRAQLAKNTAASSSDEPTPPGS